MWMKVVNETLSYFFLMRCRVNIVPIPHKFTLDMCIILYNILVYFIHYCAFASLVAFGNHAFQL